MYTVEIILIQTGVRQRQPCTDLDSFELEALLLECACLLRDSHLHLFELSMIFVQMKLEVGRSLCALNCFALVHFLSLLAQTAAAVPCRNKYINCKFTVNSK